MDKNNQDGSRWMAAVAIPMVLLIAPAVGGFLGRAIDGKFSTEPVGVLLGLVLGFIAAGFQVKNLLKRLDNDRSKS